MRQMDALAFDESINQATFRYTEPNGTNMIVQWNGTAFVTTGFVLTPPAGTAIVFGGTVTHAGEAVSAGERAVFGSPHVTASYL